MSLLGRTGRLIDNMLMPDDIVGGHLRCHVHLLSTSSRPARSAASSSTGRWLADIQRLPMGKCLRTRALNSSSNSLNSRLASTVSARASTTMPAPMVTLLRRSMTIKLPESLLACRDRHPPLVSSTRPNQSR